MQAFTEAPPAYVFTDADRNGQPSALPVKFLSYLSSVRRHLHRYPEVGFQEHATSHLVRTHLESHGLQVIGPVAKTGLYVDIKGDSPGPHIGYRCDMDALKLSDAKRVSYASQNTGAAHGCGHDAHTSIALGIALMLHAQRARIHGTVRVLFQPNEEGDPSGSIPMIEAGVCDPLEAIYCVHVDPTLDTGQFGVPEGQVTAATDRLRVRVSSPGTGHSARPHQARDTIWIATQLLNQFYQYVGRITDARNAAVLTICRISGGRTHNVIPNAVEFEGTLRTLNEADRKLLNAYMRRAATQFAELHDVSIDLVRVGGLPPVINDARLRKNVHSCVTSLFGTQARVDICVPSMGSEDFACYLQLVPGMLVRVGTRSGESTAYPLHHSCFDLDETALGLTVQLITRVLMRHLEKQIMS